MTKYIANFQFCGILFSKIMSNILGPICTMLKYTKMFGTTFTVFTKSSYFCVLEIEKLT